MSERYCSCCGFDLEECPGCGFTRDPEEQEVCPQCNADVPNGAVSMLCIEHYPVVYTPTQDELLVEFPSL